jgi:hypothetical protein
VIIRNKNAEFALYFFSSDPKRFADFRMFNHRALCPISAPKAALVFLRIILTRVDVTRPNQMNLSLLWQPGEILSEHLINDFRCTEIADAWTMMVGSDDVTAPRWHQCAKVGLR